MNDDAAVAGAAQASAGRLPRLAVFALRRALVAVSEDFARSLAPAGLRPAQYSVLEVIGSNAGVRSSQVSHMLDIQHTNLVPLLDQLEARALVERRADPRVRRARGLHLTMAGRTTMAALAGGLDAHEARLNARIGAEGSRVLLDLLELLCEPDSGTPPEG